MITHKFEHPLNEKTRIYLRVESLLRQLHLSSTFSDAQQYQLFFRSIFDLIEIFEQIQLKSELAKDIEKQRLTYKSWLNVEASCFMASLLCQRRPSSRSPWFGSRVSNHGDQR